MSLPHLLLVDDSPAVLEYERAALAGHYETSTARDGVEALELARELLPAAILLDLSMPRLDGEQVLATLKATPALREIPVVVVSSEHARGERCLGAGAVAFVPKPVRADALREVVAGTLRDEERRRREGTVAIVVARAGPLRIGIPVAQVLEVAMLPETTPLAAGPFYLREALVFRGEPACVLDLAARLGVASAVPVVERKLVVTRAKGLLVALCVDDVGDPEELPRERVVAGVDAGDGAAPVALRALARTAQGPVPLLDPAALLSPRLLRRLPGLLRAGADPAGAGRAVEP